MVMMIVLALLSLVISLMITSLMVIIVMIDCEHCGKTGGQGEHYLTDSGIEMCVP